MELSWASPLTIMAFRSSWNSALNLRLTGRVLLYAAAVFCCAFFAQEQPAKAADRKQSTYRLPFGQQNYLPSNARSEFTEFLQPSQVPTAEYCARCHETAYREWRESAHSNSFREPFYIKNVDLL